MRTVTLVTVPLFLEVMNQPERGAQTNCHLCCCSDGMRVQ